MRLRNIHLGALTGAILAISGAQASPIPAIIDVAGFTANVFARNDDESVLVSLPFDVKFGSSTYSSLFLNNNGNLTFNSALRTWTPFALAAQNQPIIAAFWGDVDTRSGPGVATYGVGSVDGHAAFGVDWVGVGYYDQHADKTNSFQEILIDRSDTGAGNFDIEYNYNQIQWETGDASGGVGGLGGQSAVMGYANGAGFVFQHPGFLVPGAYLDGGSNSLVASTFNSNNVLGRYVFQVRDGTATVPGAASETPFQPNNVTPLNGATTEATFNNVPSGSWFNPPHAELFQYIASGGSLFTEITVDPTIFTITFGDTSITLPEGTSFTFPGAGVSSFTLTGRDVGPVNLQFNQSTASFSVESTTPEVGTWWLLGTGCSSLVLLRRARSRIQKLEAGR